MTKDLTAPWETNSLIHFPQSSLFPARIPSQHYQLKNYISTADPNIIYYASSYEIFSLNISSRKRTLVKSLPWKPFCLDAAYGWICVGGDENGQCAFVKVDEIGNGRGTSHIRAEVDDLLPLDLDPDYRQIRHDLRGTEPWPRYPIGPRYELQFHELGAERVNSIKIHALDNDNKKGVESEIVAITTNNDRTVRIFSLSQSRLLETLNFQTRMNHASISPDGNLLLAVGDEIPPHNDVRAFFRKRFDVLSVADENQSPYPKYEWREFAEPKLETASEEDPCFCTAFSSSGHVCAVASQSGIITFFDTSRIRDDMDSGEATVAVLKSSKPSLRHVWSGAIRSMCFSPAPWDLFAWAEDQGHVCVVDLRNSLRSRQTISLDVDSPSVEKIEVHEHDGTSEQRQLEIERRFVERHREALEAQDHLAAVSHTADYLELAAERRWLDREAGTSRDIIHSLSDGERQMIDSIGLRRSQGNYAGPSGTPSTAPMSVNYVPNGRVDSSAWTGLTSATSPPHQQSRSTGTASIHDFMRHRNWERSRANDRSYQPRRRSSVVISNSNSNSISNSLSNTATSSPHPSSSLAPIGTSTSTLSASPSRLPSSNSELPASHVFDASDPWQTISDAMGSNNMPPDIIARLRSLQSRNHERRNQATTAPQQTLDRRMQAIQGARERSRADHTDAVEAIANRTRETNARVSRQTRASRADVVYDEVDREVLSRRLDDPRRRPRYDEGPVTMGIGWSLDGRNLYVATEEGILEYPVNIEGRKWFPSVGFL